MKVVYSPTAVRQIENQLTYLVSHGAERAAIAARERITSFVTLFLAQHPKTGRFISEKNIYEIWIPRTRFVVLYRLEDDDVLRVLALFHTAQQRSGFRPDEMD